MNQFIADAYVLGQCLSTIFLYQFYWGMETFMHICYEIGMEITLNK